MRILASLLAAWPAVLAASAAPSCSCDGCAAACGGGGCGCGCLRFGLGFGSAYGSGSACGSARPERIGMSGSAAREHDDRHRHARYMRGLGLRLGSARGSARILLGSRLRLRLCFLCGSAPFAAQLGTRLLPVWNLRMSSDVDRVGQRLLTELVHDELSLQRHMVERSIGSAARRRAARQKPGKESHRHTGQAQSAGNAQQCARCAAS